MALPNKAFVTPKGELSWVFIDGKGKKDLNGNDRFNASLKLHIDSKEFKALEKEIMDFWEENKPKGRRLKSNGIRPEKVKGSEELTGYMLANFWTGITYEDGSEKVVKIYNAKGVETSLNGKKIGNGSLGHVSGVMAIYDQGVAATGITLYLNAIQLKKLIEFTGSVVLATPDEDDDDNWSGDEFEDGDDTIEPPEDIHL